MSNINPTYLAIDFVIQLKRSHQEMAQELELLRQQATGSRQENISGFPPGGPPPLAHTSYCSSSVGPYPPPIILPHQPNHSGHSDSRPNSNQNMFPPPLQNGHPNRIEGPST